VLATLRVPKAPLATPRVGPIGARALINVRLALDGFLDCACPDALAEVLIAGRIGFKPIGLLKALPAITDFTAGVLLAPVLNPEPSAHTPPISRWIGVLVLPAFQFVVPPVAMLRAADVAGWAGFVPHELALVDEPQLSCARVAVTCSKHPAPTQAMVSRFLKTVSLLQVILLQITR